MQLDDELLARKLQEEESASLRKRTRKPSKAPVCDINILSMLQLYFQLFTLSLYSQPHVGLGHSPFPL